MREILFRGKRIDNNEWIYGYLIKGATRYVIQESIAQYPQYDVIPETIGQYTGLVDKNGTKIFEGDLLLSSYEYENETTRDKEYLKTDYGSWNCGCCNFVYGYKFDNHYIYAQRDSEGNLTNILEAYVVGNIYEERTN